MGMLEAVLSPVTLMIVLMIAGLTLGLSTRRAGAGRRLLVTGVLLFLVFTFSPLAELLVGHLEARFSPMLAVPLRPAPDRIVVLSGYAETHAGFPTTSALSDETLGRLAEGLRLYRTMGSGKMVVSGGAMTRDVRPLACVMQDFLAQAGVPRDDIIPEARSHNTYENLVEVRKLVGERPFVLVTSAAHLPRAMAVAKKLGMSPLPAPARFWSLQHYPARITDFRAALSVLRGFAHPSTERLQRLDMACHEYLGYFWYWLLGRL